jgi:hypothetical protein
MRSLWAYLIASDRPPGSIHRIADRVTLRPRPSTVSLLRLRGVILNAALTCPICGGETMRVSRPRGLRTVLSLLRCRYRLCRHCFRTWLSWR